MEFGLDTLRDLPVFEALEDAGLLSKQKVLAGDIPTNLIRESEDEADGGVTDVETLRPGFGVLSVQSYDQND